MGALMFLPLMAGPLITAMALTGYLQKELTKMQGHAKNAWMHIAFMWLVSVATYWLMTTEFCINVFPPGSNYSNPLC